VRRRVVFVVPTGGDDCFCLPAVALCEGGFTCWSEADRHSRVDGFLRDARYPTGGVVGRQEAEASRFERGLRDGYGAVQCHTYAQLSDHAFCHGCDEDAAREFGNVAVRATGHKLFFDHIAEEIPTDKGQKAHCNAACIAEAGDSTFTCHFSDILTSTHYGVIEWLSD